MAMTDSVSWNRRPVFGVHDVTLVPLAISFAVGVFVVLPVHSASSGGLGARLAELTMIAPVAFARRAPLPAAALQAAATLFNQVVFGDLVRCGVALPAAFYVAFVLGNRAAGWARMAGLVCELAGVALQCSYDPRLHPFSTFALMGPASLLFFGAGMVVRSRSVLVVQLRERNAQLREQRDRTARLAIETDRARMRTDFGDTLRTSIRQIARTADAARSGEDPTDASFAAIEHAGRDVLDRMREVVGTMRTMPTDPEPGLVALANLVRTATTADVRLTVSGDARPLPASIELSGYRIVEQLLSALEDDPAAQVQVRVNFERETLELYVIGPMARNLNPAGTLAVVRDRAAMHGGTVEFDQPAQSLQARICLPLVSGHA